MFKKDAMLSGSFFFSLTYPGCLQQAPHPRHLNFERSRRVIFLSITFGGYKNKLRFGLERVSGVDSNIESRLCLISSMVCARISFFKM